MKKALLVFMLCPFFLGMNYSKIDKVIDLTEIGGNLSGITYNSDTQTYFLIQNNYGHIFEYDGTFSKPLRVITMINAEDKDTEDIVYLGNQQYAISSETNKILIVTIKPGQTELDMDASLDDVQLFQLPPPSKNNLGLEGVCYAKNKERFFAVQEGKPMRLFTFAKPVTNSDYRHTADLKVEESFNLKPILKHRMDDLSSCLYDDKTDSLILMSHESSRLLSLDSAGNVKNTLDLPAVAPQYEGFTFGPQNELILASEPNFIVIMKP